MKILHLIYSEGIYGAEKYLKNLLPGLNAKGITCHLIVVSPKRTAGAFINYCNELNELGVKTSLLVAPMRSIVVTAKKVNTYLKANHINIVHSHLIKADLIAALLKTLFYREVFLLSTRHGYQEKFLQHYIPGKSYRPFNLFYFLTRFTLLKIDKNVAVSKGIADLYYDLGLAKTPYPVVYNGISVEPFNKEVNSAVFKLAGQQLIILGRIELIKGHRFLIDAMPMVVKKFPEIKLLILGDGTEKNNCMRRVMEKNLQQNIVFLNFNDNPYQYISHSDILIQPSLFEPFGLVYIEAFALKTAVIAFDTPAGNEIMVNNDTALLVEKADSAALAEKIVFLLNNKEVSHEITTRAYKKYSECFTSGIMVKNMSDWYLSLGV